MTKSQNDRRLLLVRERMTPGIPMTHREGAEGITLLLNVGVGTGKTTALHPIRSLATRLRTQWSENIKMNDDEGSTGADFLGLGLRDVPWSYPFSSECHRT